MFDIGDAVCPKCGAHPIAGCVSLTKSWPFNIRFAPWPQKLPPLASSGAARRLTDILEQIDAGGERLARCAYPDQQAVDEISNVCYSHHNGRSTGALAIFDN